MAIEEESLVQGEGDVRVVRLEQQLHAARSERNAKVALAKALSDENTLLKKALDESAAIRQPVSVIKFKAPRVKKGGRDRAIAGAIGSDWHVGERVDEGQTNGLNEYNPEIAEARAERFFHRLVWLVGVHRSAVDIDTLVLCLLGDLMTGFIHEDLRQTNYLSPTEEIRFLKRILISGINYLLEQDFLKIRVPCIWGNHGRINYDRELINAAMRNSYEAMLYWDLADHYKDEKRIDFAIAEGPLLYATIEDYSIRCTHGNSFRFAGGIGGITVPLIKAVQRWDRGVEADLTVMGHWHNYLDLGYALVNGSNKGVDPFSLKHGFAPEPAQQAYFMFDPKSRRRLDAAPIFVEPSEDWVKRRQALRGGV